MDSMIFSLVWKINYDCKSLRAGRCLVPACELYQGKVRHRVATVVVTVAMFAFVCSARLSDADQTSVCAHARVFTFLLRSSSTDSVHNKRMPTSSAAVVGSGRPKPRQTDHRDRHEFEVSPYRIVHRSTLSYSASARISSLARPKIRRDTTIRDGMRVRQHFGRVSLYLRGSFQVFRATITIRHTPVSLARRRKRTALIA